ncbi:unnamed protein product, partial [Didymodactylos carnosus]
MPAPSLRRKHSEAAASNRWNTEKLDEKQASSDQDDEFAVFLLCHDESTFRSGGVSAKRWTIDNQTPFFNKGRGRSHMVSDFLVAHPSGPFLALTHSEYKQA